MLKLIVVDQPAKWDIEIPGAKIISAGEYLNDVGGLKQKNVRVFNLSDEYKYQSSGYYVSLVAEARGHRPSPDVKNIIDFKQQSLTKILSGDLDTVINKSLKNLTGDHFKLSVYFGKNTENKYNDLAKELHKLFRAPLLRANFIKSKRGWELRSIKTIALKDVPKYHLALMKEYAREFLSKKRYYTSKGHKFQYDLGILVDPDDPAPASNRQALQKFIEVGEKLGFYVELIEENDYNRLSTFDALFVRMNTHVKNFSYKFVRKAESEGLAIVDHAENILKCGNKVYMAEVLRTANLPIPKSYILHRDNWKDYYDTLKFPCILKLPDSSFSFGVKKVGNKQELENMLTAMFSESDLVIVQEYIYTDYDWRVAILDNSPLFACKYYMAKGHWQIYNWESKIADDQSGLADTFDIKNVPEPIIEMALKTAALINKKGLFGVDLKEVNGRIFVIEVNDNPNIDFGCEDLVLKDELYSRILMAFKQRIEEKFNAKNGRHF